MLVVDTGPIVAAADTADRDHEACRRLLSTAQGPLIESPLVVAEAAYLIGRQLGLSAEAEFFPSISDGDLVIESLTVADLARVADLVDAYVDLGLGGNRRQRDCDCRAVGAVRDRHAGPAALLGRTSRSRGCLPVGAMTGAHPTWPAAGRARSRRIYQGSTGTPVDRGNRGMEVYAVRDGEERFRRFAGWVLGGLLAETLEGHAPS